MKLQVPLTIAARLWTWLAASATPSAWTIGMPPPTLPSKATARPYLRACAKTSRPVLGQQRLVGGDHILAGGQGLEDERKVGIDPPHRLDHDRDLGVVDDPSRRRSRSGPRPSRRHATFQDREPTAHFRSIRFPERTAIRSPSLPEQASDP